MKETFAEYLKRVLRQKGLKPRDIKERCGIAESYTRRMLKGEVKNLTVETIGNLAKGLDVDPVELFMAASGQPRVKADVDLILLADTVQQIILKPELVQIVQEWSKLSSRHQKTLLNTFRLLKEKKTSKKNRK